MKRLLILIAIFTAVSTSVQAQSYELQRLILDIQKLAELKSVLSDLYKGYQILETGYNTIKDLSEGSFNLHKAFLNGLLLVSPAVRNYEKVQVMLRYQAAILKEYKLAMARFRSQNRFQPDELVYVAGVYDHLIDQSAQNVEALVDVLTAGKLRMSDAERLERIDGLCTDSKNQFLFLRQFNNSTEILGNNRKADWDDQQTLRQLYNIR